MATTSAVPSSRTTLHLRGTWSARDDRLPSAVWLGILWAAILAGFIPDLSRFAHESPPAPAIIYVHGFVFTSWLLLLTAQVLLVLGDRVAWHKRLGWFAAGCAALMAVLGPWAAMASQSISLHGSNFDPPFLSLQLLDVAAFVGLVSWGFALRKNPAAHKRMMILATVALGNAGWARFDGLFLPQSPHSMLPWFLWNYYGDLMLIALMTTWDWWRGRLMRPFVLGAAALVACELLASALYFWAPWQALTLSWVQAWARL